MRLFALDDTKPRRSQKCSGGQHALIIGASSAGLLAARILSDYFEQVTVVERDQLPTQPGARQGVPQGKHVHLLMGKGVAIMAEFFPALRADGALLLAPTDDFRWFHFGNWKLQFSGPLRLHSQSRPLLEYHIHHRVANLPNVCLYENCEVLGLIGDHRCGITGVSMRYGRGNAQYQGCVPTNLVVDASGRGSQMAHWLSALGYPPVEETLVKIDVGYASRIYHCPDPALSEWKVLGIYPWPLEMKRFGYIFPIEGNRWIVTLSGCLRDHPPIDEAGFLEFAKSLAQPHIYEVIPLSPISLHKFPADRRRHYERLPSMPDGLVVLGDAACSFNPVYGQGMTVAALEAMTLGTCLEQHLRSHAANMIGFPQRFQKALASVVEIPWLFATCEDFRYAQTEGHRLWARWSPLLQRLNREVDTRSHIGGSGHTGKSFPCDGLHPRRPNLDMDLINSTIQIGLSLEFSQKLRNVGKDRAARNFNVPFIRSILISARIQAEMIKNEFYTAQVHMCDARV